MAERMNTAEASRRAFVKKAAYVAPLILTLNAAPAFAKHGSGKGKGHPHGVAPGPPPDVPPGG